MSVPELYRLFVSSLNMMAMRGYCVESFREFIDVYNVIRHCQKNGEDYSDLIREYTNTNISAKIKEIMLSTFGYSSGTRNIRDDYTYAVMNYTTGDTCLVFFSCGKDDNFLATDLNKVINYLEGFSKNFIGDKDFCRPNSGIKAVICLKGKMGPNPREKIDKISNLDVISDKIVLSNVYDNVMQSQHSLMTVEETEEFIAESHISKSNYPSISKRKDQYYGYLGAEVGTIDRIHRAKISEEEMLDVTLFYRRIT